MNDPVTEAVLDTLAGRGWARYEKNFHDRGAAESFYEWLYSNSGIDVMLTGPHHTTGLPWRVHYRAKEDLYWYWDRNVSPD